MNTPNHASLQLSFPSDNELLITRAFDAPRHLVFDVITKVEHVRHWYGPRYLTLISCEIDLQVGGKWRYVVQAPDGSQHAFSGEYLELDPPKRLVSSEWYEAIPGADYVATVTLEEQNGKTKFSNLLRYKSKEHRDGHVNSGMEGGMSESYERMDELLAQMVGSTLDVVVSRHFTVAAEQVFDAWLDPATLGHWFFATPTGEMKRVEIDARVGGEFVIAEQRGEVLAEHVGRYIEINRPQRLVFSFAVDKAEKPSLVSVTIMPTENGCELQLTHTMDVKWAEYAERTSGGWSMILEGLYHEVTAD